jgi:Cellulase (glycosyl hydrolase family 5)
VAALLILIAVSPLGADQVARAQTAYLHVAGNRLVTPGGQEIQLKGAMRDITQAWCSGSPDWQPVQFSEGPTDVPSVQAVASWGLNLIRVPLNEDCWLGINGAPLGGTAYQNDVINFVNNITSQGLYVILTLHWNAPGTTLAQSQQPMADEDHSPAFWTSVANTFENNGNVIFDLYNEPNNISWSCLLNGCTATSEQGAQYQTAGMQQLVNTVRATGAGNLLMVGGLNWSNDLSQWLQYKPSDPDNNLAASWHDYDAEPPGSTYAAALTVAAQYPVIAGEMGSAIGGTQGGNPSVWQPMVSWFNSTGISYDAEAWNTSSGTPPFSWSQPELITSFDGTPTSYGAGYQAAVAGSGAGSNWDDLSGLATAGPAICSQGPNELDAIVANGWGVYQKTWNGSSWSSSWSQLPAPPVNAMGVSCVSWGSGNIDLVILGTDNQTYVDSYISGNWGGSWTNLGGFATAVSICSQTSNELDVLVSSYYGDYQKTWNGSSWSPSWSQLPSTPVTARGVSCVSWGNGNINLAVLGSDGQTYVDSYSNGTWGGSWTSLGGYATAGPAISSQGANELDVFVANETAVYQNTWNGSSWSGWSALPGSPGGASGVASVSWGSGRIDAAIIGSNSQTYHDSSTNGTWN